MNEACLHAWCTCRNTRALLACPRAPLPSPSTPLPDAQAAHSATVGQLQRDRQRVGCLEGHRLTCRHGLVACSAFPAPMHGKGCNETMSVSANVRQARGGRWSPTQRQRHSWGCSGSSSSVPRGAAGEHVRTPAAEHQRTWAARLRPPQTPPGPAPAAGPSAPACPQRIPRAPAAGKGSGKGSASVGAP